MPEGDTVWRAARSLDRALSGQVLTAAELRVPALATVELAGRPVLGTASRGKHLLTRLGPHPDADVDPDEPVRREAAPGHDAATPLTLHTHLKMEGSWHLVAPGGRWRRPAHEARVVLRTPPWTAVGFALGVVEVLPTAREATVVGHLGPDLLGGWTEEAEAEAVRRLLADPARPVGDAVLDQRVMAGVGNLYRNELCFVMGLHPRTPVGEVPDPVRLVRRARQMLLLNAEQVVQATTGDTRRGRQHWVYRREGQRCRRCGTPLSVDMLGEATRERAAYWCPRCQPAP